MKEAQRHREESPAFQRATVAGAGWGGIPRCRCRYRSRRCLLLPRSGGQAEGGAVTGAAPPAPSPSAEIPPRRPALPCRAMRAGKASTIFPAGCSCPLPPFRRGDGDEAGQPRSVRSPAASPRCPRLRRGRVPEGGDRRPPARSQPAAGAAASRDLGGSRTSPQGCGAAAPPGEPGWAGPPAPAPPAARARERAGPAPGEAAARGPPVIESGRQV